jgi:hypothetical protein
MALLIRNGGMPQFKHRPTQFEQGRSITVPAPYGGLNLRDDITALKPNEARVLENFAPTSGQVAIRPGYTAHGTGVGTGQVETLAAFMGLTADDLLAAGGGKIFDATAAGAGAELATGFTVNRWQTTLYNDRLFFVNGTDAPQVYNGSTVAGIVWTGSGLTNTNLVNIALVRNRLWFCENNKADVWYGGIGQITAASDLVKFQLSQIAEGGTCTAIGSWSRDAGDGADDMTVFVMSTGEIIIYQGDPSTSFALIGKYKGAPPIGRQCLFKVGGELLIITRLGLLPVSAAIGGVALDLARIDPWGKIAPGLVQDATQFGSNVGWWGCLHEGVVYVNVPQGVGSLSKQWVMNTRNGAWTTYRRWNACSMVSFGNDLYFGALAGGLVRKVGGSQDIDQSITALSRGAFVTPTNTFQSNLFTSIRPKLESSGTATGALGVDTDFILRSAQNLYVDLADSSNLTEWGDDWGSPWSDETSSDPIWFGCEGSGRSVSVRFRAEVNAGTFNWFATDLLFKPGGYR